MDFQEHLVILASSFPAPDPKKWDNTSRVKDFGDGRRQASALGKLAASYHLTRRASPDWPCKDMLHLLPTRKGNGSIYRADRDGGVIPNQAPKDPKRDSASLNFYQNSPNRVPNMSSKLLETETICQPRGAIENVQRLDHLHSYTLNSSWS